MEGRRPDDEREPGEGGSEGADDGGEAEREGREPPSEDRVRLELLLFSQLIQRLADEGSLMRALPVLMGRLGDLRQLLFDYEVRSTERLMPVEDPAEREARRILREMEEREREMREEWEESGWTPPEDDEDESAGDEDGEPAGG